MNSSALEICPNDPKALYRRCLAFEKTGRMEEAYKDAVLLIKVDPKNEAIGPVLKRLTPVIRERVKPLYCVFSINTLGTAIWDLF